MQTILRRYSRLSKDYPNFNIIMSTFLFLIGLVIFLSFFSKVFLTPRNMINIFTQVAVYVILGVGMTLVMATGGIDISIGSMIGLTTTFLGTVMLGYGFSWWFSILLCILAGGVCGAFNGMLIVKFKVPPIIVTLGTMTLFRGLAYAYQEGRVHYGFPEQLLWIGRARILGLPVPIWIAIVVFLLGHYFLTRTRTGRHICAVGGNMEAARLSGINTGLLLFLVYVILGFLVGLATIILTARLDAAQATAGTGMDLHTIAGVVVGGTALSGGRAFMVGTLLGMIILGVLENGLLLAGIGFYWQRVFIGIIFIMVVASRTFKEKQTAVS
ncbi:MAG: ABC transporter permease [Dethiobacter sp.]|jgi:inositol transport system permease protein|nr:ABC transporter permease [Dethiobacter sp.]